MSSTVGMKVVVPSVESTVILELMRSEWAQMGLKGRSPYLTSIGCGGGMTFSGTIGTVVYEGWHGSSIVMVPEYHPAALILNVAFICHEKNEVQPS